MKKIQLIAMTFLLTFALNASGLAQDASENDGKVTREGFDLYYRITGSKGSSVLILSGGPGSDNRYMQPIADELSKNYRCVMLEQRGTGRSVLKKYNSSTINWKAYFEDIEALRKHLRVNKFILVGNSWGMMLALAYGGT